MKYRILYPVFLQFLDGQSFEQFLFPLKVGLGGGNQKTFTEATRTAEEIVAACLSQLINPGGFIDVDISLLADFLEVLYSFMIYFIAHTVHCF